MLKRSPFKSKAPERRPCKTWDGPSPTPRTPALRVDDGKARACVPIEKRVYVRSKKLMKAYGTIPCQRCSAVNQTVCGAHSNWAIHGKGKSIKADDNRAASMCGLCHHDIDQGSALTEVERRAIWWGAHVRTIEALVSLGRWPAGVPVPSLEFPLEWA